MNITTGKCKTGSMTVEKTFEDNQGPDMQEAEEIAYDELKPKYL